MLTEPAVVTMVAPNPVLPLATTSVRATLSMALTSRPFASLPLNVLGSIVTDPFVVVAIAPDAPLSLASSPVMYIFELESAISPFE